MTTETTDATINLNLTTSSDVEVLQQFMKFFDRVDIGTEFIQTDDVVTHERLVIVCGQSIIESPPLELEWPLEYVIPAEGFGGVKH